MNFKEFFDIGFNFEAFVGTGSKSERDRIPKNYGRIKLTPELNEEVKALPPVNFLVVGEMWCPDVQLNSTVVRKLCEINHNFDMKIITKGRGEKFLKPLLEIENFKIPLILVLNEKYDLLGTFTEKPKRVKAVAEFETIKMEYLKGAYLPDTIDEIVEIIKAEKK